MARIPPTKKRAKTPSAGLKLADKGKRAPKKAVARRKTPKKASPPKSGTTKKKVASKRKKAFQGTQPPRVPGKPSRASKHKKKVAPPSAWREKAAQERKVRRFRDKGYSREEALVRIQKNKAAYEKRIARYVDHDGYSRPVARGHARPKEGELGIAKGRWFANEIITQPPGAKARRELRKGLLAQFGIVHFEAEKGFVEQKITRNGQKGPADWHRRKRMYAKVAIHLEMLFGVESNQAYALMFSP